MTLATPPTIAAPTYAPSLYPVPPAQPPDAPVMLRVIALLPGSPIVEERVDLLGSGERTPRVEECGTLVAIMHLHLIVATVVTSLNRTAEVRTRVFVASPGDVPDSWAVLDDRPLADKPVTHAATLFAIEAHAVQMAGIVEARRREALAAASEGRN